MLRRNGWRNHRHSDRSFPRDSTDGDGIQTIIRLPTRGSTQGLQAHAASDSGTLIAERFQHDHAVLRKLLSRRYELNSRLRKQADAGTLGDFWTVISVGGISSFDTVPSGRPNGFVPAAVGFDDANGYVLNSSGKRVDGDACTSNRIRIFQAGLVQS